MRIAIVTADWPCTTGGGVAAVTATLADALHADGHTIEVWTRGGGRRDGALSSEGRGYPVVGLPGRSWRRRGAGHWRRGLPGLLTRFRPDRVLFSTWDPLPGATDALEGRRPWVFAHGRDVCGDPGADRRAARDAIFESDIRWFCFTRWMADELRARGAEAVHVVPAAVPEATTLRAPVADRVLAVGRLVPRKGQDVLIEAVASHPSLRLDLVGEGPDRDRLLGIARSCGVADRVHLHGFVPAATLEELWSMATCFALPVRDEGDDVEGFGLVYLEAAARGVPAIGGRSSGAAEAIVHGETGLLVDEPRDTAAVANTLAVLLEDPERAASLAAGARARYEAAHTPSHLAAAVLAALVGS